MTHESTALKTPEDESLLSRLPPVHGKLRANADLSGINWFQVGGPAEVLFRPEDVQDLADFIARMPQDIPVTILGVGSNLIIRDGGIEGVVIRLGRGFVDCIAEGDRLIVGAGTLCLNAAICAQEAGITGLEFLSGIPGTIGGALAMNAGAYGSDTSTVLLEAQAVNANGEIHTLSKDQIGYSYRHHELGAGWIFTRGVFKGTRDDPAAIAARMAEIKTKRESTQPIRSRTGGSTFKNPPTGARAWELIDQAGCRGLKIGNAQMSEMHCNFMINTGEATAAELENLGEEVRRRVKEKCGVQLEWEIRRIGIPTSTVIPAKAGIQPRDK